MRSRVNGRNSESPSEGGLNNGDGSLTNGNIKCISCGAPFEFSVGEQVYYKTHRIPNLPQRCKSCREERLHAKISKGYPTSRKRYG